MRDHMVPCRQDLLRGLAKIQLANDSNWYYVNASFLTTMWSFLSSNQCSLTQWGPNTTQLALLLLHHEFEPVELDTVPCFHEILAQWQGLGQQGDPVEFLAHMMRGLNFTGIWGLDRNCR